MNIFFEIPGNIQAQERPKFSTINGHARAVDPIKSRDFKHFVKMVAAEHAPAALIETEIRLFVDIYRPIPKSMSKKNRAYAISGALRPTKKPDLDNLVKGIKDGLSKVIWHDDAQIVEMTVRKFYSENPRAVVKIDW
ncbi:Holliday junction resolvase RusA-like endonuclease [Psychrobacillus insolitus]|uniref:Holliday junction resolvase RusA-like endonuclease n=1 Tax=Psychrobacillus insolitus TaxID=1461 RepID=A0A2W7MKR0_9BACI|nr:RusA family crossover junction endodeoxyribonuclease [Psychrobacillus insolitus]PZX07922.1 Holliday junction resolvase RusA-like endonuclease [Psychrobacillus insolitus]